MPDTIIRTAEPTDVEEIIRGYEWLFAPPGSRPPQWDPERAAAALDHAISSDAAVIFMAMLDDQLVGLCTGHEDIESVRFGRRVWIEDLAVHPAQRSRGIGKQLLDAAKEWAASRGAKRLQLDSSVARADAHRFYEREQPDWRSLSFGWQL